jgi:hypothetical protein
VISVRPSFAPCSEGLQPFPHEHGRTFPVEDDLGLGHNHVLIYENASSSVQLWETAVAMLRRRVDVQLFNDGNGRAVGLLDEPDHYPSSIKKPAEQGALASPAKTSQHNSRETEPHEKVLRVIGRILSPVQLSEADAPGLTRTQGEWEPNPERIYVAIQYKVVARGIEFDLG